MKITITITTDDEAKAKRLLIANGLCSALYEMRETMIRDRKYNGGKKTTEQWLDELDEIMRAEHIYLEEIWA